GEAEKSLRESIGAHRLVDIAIQPALAGLRRSDDRVTADLCVPRGVPVDRTVAAVRLAAGLAGTQMNPAVTAFHALLARQFLGMSQVGDGKVFAGVSHDLPLIAAR